MKSRLLTLSALALLATACGQPSPESMVNETVQANAAAASHTDWEMSPKHPSRVFDVWRRQKRDSSEVCVALQQRKPDELTLFEEEIRRKMNENLVGPCKAKVLADVEAYWAVQINRTKHVRLDFKFPAVTERMDFSEGQYIVNADLKPKQVVLTFDDGPHAAHTDVILRNLRKVGAKSIFFHMGQNVRRNPDIVKRVAADGHGVGSHSMTHQCLAPTTACEKNNIRGMLSYAQATTEILSGHQAVQDVLGWVDPFFRFPYGASAVELKRFVAERGAGEFFWSIDSLDWKNQPPAMIVDSVMYYLEKNRERGVILMHDIQKRTAVALPQLLSRLHSAGYSVINLRPERETAKFESKLVQRPLVRR